MLGEGTPRSVQDSEDARAFLQQRVALFWKVMCFIMLFGTVLAAVGAMKEPGGPDLLVDFGLAVQAGFCWWLCRRGVRSVRFSRAVEALGLLVYFTGASFLGRFVLVQFLKERALVTPEAVLMADAYLSALGLVGAALMIVVRAALIPSSPRRTILYASAGPGPSPSTAALRAPAA